jgi:hypothetical protein
LRQIDKNELGKLEVEALIIKDMTSKQTLYAKEPFKEVQACEFDESDDGDVGD